MFPKNFQPKDLLFLDKMVTPGFMTIVYWACCALAALGTLVGIITAILSAPLRGLLMVPVFVLILALAIIYIRIVCEVLTVLFKINSNLQKIADKE